jgi:hypothetical protein
MNLDELLNEKIKKVHGKWALVSKSNPDKVLQYYHGKDHPSKEWEKKVERRVHAFSESTSYHTDIKVDFGKLPKTTINFIISSVKGPFGHLKNNESVRWLDHAKVIQFSRHNTLLRVKNLQLNNVLRTLNNYNVKYEIVKNDIDENYANLCIESINEADINKTIDDIRQNVHADELEGLKRYSNAQLADWLKRLTAKNKSVIGPAIATANALGPMAKPFARTFVQRQYPTVDNDEFEQMWGVWNRMDDETRSAIKTGDLSTLDPRDEHGFVKEADDDYDTWKQRAIERAKRQAEKKRAELQQVMKGVETDPEKLALQGTIQAARGELSKRKREALEKMEQLAQRYAALPPEELDKIIARYSKGPGIKSDFVEWLKSIKQEREDELAGIQQRRDLLKSVAGTVQGKQSHKAAPAQDAPWTQMGIDRKSFRKILNNPQHPKHREARSLHAQYKPVAEDLTRRDFLKGVGGVTALGLASGAAKAFGLKDPTKTDEPDEKYVRFTGSSQSPLHAQPRLDLNNKYNRVGINQRGNQFSVVLTKKHGLYLYFVVSDFAQDPYVYIELKGGEKYKFRKRTLNNNTFTIEDDRIAATLLNYEGPFNVYVDNDVYTFNIASSPDAQKLYRWWKEGKHEGL